MHPKIPAQPKYRRPLAEDDFVIMTLVHLSALGFLLVAAALFSGCRNTSFGGENTPSRQPGVASTKRTHQEPSSNDYPNLPPSTETGTGPISSIRAGITAPSPLQTILATVDDIIKHAPPQGQSDAGSQAQGATQPGDQTLIYAQPGPAPCSDLHYVPATANPYFAGTADGTTISYNLSQGGGPDPTDRSPKHNPVLARIIGDCFHPGQSVIFRVDGMITYDPKVAPVSANGRTNQIVSHQKGGYLGKSDITAPFCALIAVFLDDNAPSSAAAPPPLNFATPASRDYDTISPAIGQIFFIGDGFRSNGEFRRVIIPQAATRLYFGVMDTYQWNNNLGGVRVQLFGIN